MERTRDEVCGDCRGDKVISGAVCARCFGTGIVNRRCRECFGWRTVGDFLVKARLVRRCRDCRVRAEVPRDRELDRTCELRVKFVRFSRNSKTGPIPVSMVSPNTCSPTCPWMGAGCYAEQHFVGMHWRRLAKGSGLTWDEYCEAVRALPRGQIWRHAEAGDLPGDGDLIHGDLLRQLVVAAEHTRGFTYTHKPVLGREAGAWNRAALANNQGPGLVVNLSADGLEDVDRKADLGIGPVTVTIPDDGHTTTTRTPAGRFVMVCPAVRQTVGSDDAKKVTCESCGLCQRRNRKSIVAFPTHGSWGRRMGESLVQLRLFDT